MYGKYGKQSSQVNIKVISEVEIKTKQTEILRWQYISTDTINIHFYTINKNILHSIEPTNKLFGIDLPNNGPTNWGQVGHPRHLSLQGQLFI